MIPLDIAGQRVGRLVALRPVVSGTQGRMWKCRCDCGGMTLVAARRWKMGLAHSCGCLQHLVVHGHKPRVGASAEYSAWSGMKSRCYRAKDTKFAEYGGRGIRVCRRWLHSFTNFLKDMGKRPQSHTKRNRSEFSLDRRNVDGHYTPSNCRWATQRQQIRNRR